MNPLIVVGSFALLNWSLNVNIKDSFIDLISSLTFLVYMVHENDMIKNTIRPLFFSMIYNKGYYTHLALICFASALSTFLISTVFAFVYSVTIGRVTEKVSIKVDHVIKKISDLIVYNLGKWKVN